MISARSGSDASRALASSKGIGRHWAGSSQADALDAKADALAVLAAAGAPMQALQIVSAADIYPVFRELFQRRVAA